MSKTYLAKLVKSLRKKANDHAETARTICDPAAAWHGGARDALRAAASQVAAELRRVDRTAKP